MGTPRRPTSPAATGASGGLRIGVGGSSLQMNLGRIVINLKPRSERPSAEKVMQELRPTLTGLDAPKVDGASNTLVPSARAKISMRIAPGDTTAHAVECLRRHVEAHLPWGAELTFDVVDTGEATQIEATGPAYDAARAAFTEAWDGVEPIDMGVGGSIPFIAEFLESFPDASVLVTGVEDPDTRAHGANEGLHLAEFERVCLAEALLLDKLAN